LKDLWSDGVSTSPADIGHGVCDTPLGLSCAISTKHEEDTGIALLISLLITEKRETYRLEALHHVECKDQAALVARSRSDADQDDCTD